MSDTLLPYYDRELAAIKRLAAEFADTHPKIAGRLRLSADAVDDPHVARLLEGVAFLAGRVHLRLDDEFPELTDSLLGLLYPHYLAPVPSCMVAQLDCAPELLIPARLAAGMAFETEPVHGETLRYRSTSAVTLWPVEVENVRLSGLPIVAPYHWLRAVDPLPHSWDVTSDSIAAWVAGAVGAQRLLLVKPVSDGGVDRYFGHVRAAQIGRAHV
jgi:type VI secretion system protein ImpG